MPESTARNILIAGAGALGQAIAQALPRSNPISLVRRGAAVPTPSSNIQWIQGDLLDPGSFAAAIAKPDIVVFSASPDSRTAANYRSVYIDALSAMLQAFPNARFLLCSSTAVYPIAHWQQAEHLPELLDELSKPQPDDFNGQILLDAENLLRPGDTVLRLGGIYGPGRNYLLKLALAGQPVLREPGLFSNRIHISDAARVIAKLVALDHAPAIVNLIDHAPCPQFEVLDYLCAQRKLPALPARAPVPGESIGKRIVSRFHTEAWFALEYPSYVAGYQQ